MRKDIAVELFVFIYHAAKRKTLFCNFTAGGTANFRYFCHKMRHMNGGAGQKTRFAIFYNFWHRALFERQHRSAAHERFYHDYPKWFSAPDGEKEGIGSGKQLNFFIEIPFAPLHDIFSVKARFHPPYKEFMSLFTNNVSGDDKFLFCNARSLYRFNNSFFLVYF